MFFSFFSNCYYKDADLFAQRERFKTLKNNLLNISLSLKNPLNDDAKINKSSSSNIEKIKMTLSLLLTLKANNEIIDLFKKYHAKIYAEIHISDKFIHNHKKNHARQNKQILKFYSQDYISNYYDFDKSLKFTIKQLDRQIGQINNYSNKNALKIIRGVERPINHV